MCGIAGLLALRRGARRRRDELAAMIARLRHRGPDGFGFHVDGARRPRARAPVIIDLAGGDQPIHNEDGTRVGRRSTARSSTTSSCARSSSARGHRFSHALRHRSHRAPLRAARRRLRRASQRPVRDRAVGLAAAGAWCSRATAPASGRCSTREAAGRLAFASEVKALLALPERARARSIRGRSAQVFTLLVAAARPTRCSRASRRCRPGTCSWSSDGTERLRALLGLGLSRRAASQPTRSSRGLRRRAARAADRRGAPAAARRRAGGRVPERRARLVDHRRDDPTLSPTRRCARSRSTFEDAEFDESALPAASWSRTWAPTTRRCAARTADIGAAFPRAIWHAETPILRTAPAPLMLLVAARCAREGYKVVLTGEGADEVFGGYDLFKEAKVRRFWARAPDSTWRARAARASLSLSRHSPARGSRARRRRFFGRAWSTSNSRSSRTCRAGRRRGASWQFLLAATLRAALGEWRSRMRRCSDAAAPASALAAARPRPIRRSAHAAVGLPAVLAGRSHGHGQFGRGPLPVPRPSRHRVRQPPAAAAEAARPHREIHAEARVAATCCRAAIAARTKQPYRAPDSAELLRRAAGRSTTWPTCSSAGQRARRRATSIPTRSRKLWRSAAPAAPSASPTTWRSSACSPRCSLRRACSSAATRRDTDGRRPYRRRLRSQVETMHAASRTSRARARRLPDKMALVCDDGRATPTRELDRSARRGSRRRSQRAASQRGDRVAIFLRQRHRGGGRRSTRRCKRRRGLHADQPAHQERTSSPTCSNDAARSALITHASLARRLEPGAGAARVPCTPASWSGDGDHGQRSTASARCCRWRVRRATGDGPPRDPATIDQDLAGHHLHLGLHRRAQRRDAHAPQHGDGGALGQRLPRVARRRHHRLRAAAGVRLRPVPDADGVLTSARPSCWSVASPSRCRCSRSWRANGSPCFPGVPTVFALLMDLDDRCAATICHRLRMITNTAAALSEDAHPRELRALFPQATLFSMYGLTECKRVTLPAARAARYPARPASAAACRTRRSGWSTRTGKRLPNGSTGELVIRGEQRDARLLGEAARDRRAAEARARSRRAGAATPATCSAPTTRAISISSRARTTSSRAAARR